jgi:cysteine desulfurase family protein
MSNPKIIYLDHAATSWPKPERVASAVADAISNYGANPGRGAHRLAVHASRVIMQTRYLLAKLLHVKNPNDIIFTSNTSMALNMVIQGLLVKGDHVIYSSIEHNSVRRPLEERKASGLITIEAMQTSEQGDLNLSKLKGQLEQTKTRLVIVNHASNLLGSVFPISEIIELAHQYGALVLIDAAQTAGTYPIDIERLKPDFVAVPGHKGLLGPQGTAALYISPKVDLKPFIYGGTGSQSEMIEQPTVRPDRYETGTLNTPGIAGLREGLNYVIEQTVDAIHQKEWLLTQQMMRGLAAIPDLHILGPAIGENRVGIVSFVIAQQDSAKVAFELDQTYGIAVRAGYHCTPLAHETAGTLETGAIRASVGWSTTEEEVDVFITAVKAIVLNGN